MNFYDGSDSFNFYKISMGYKISSLLEGMFHPTFSGEIQNIPYATTKVYEIFNHLKIYQIE